MNTCHIHVALRNLWRLLWTHFSFALFFVLLSTTPPPSRHICKANESGSPNDYANAAMYFFTLQGRCSLFQEGGYYFFLGTPRNSNESCLLDSPMCSSFHCLSVSVELKICSVCNFLSKSQRSLLP